MMDGMTNTARCERGAPGWLCTRDSDHDGPCAAVPLDEVDDDRAQRVRDELDRAQPGDVFAYQQPAGKRVLLVVARFEPTGIAGTTAVTT